MSAESKDMWVVELSKSEVKTFKINSFLMYFGVVFILAQSLLPTPMSVVNVPDYIAFGIAALFLGRYSKILKAYKETKEITVRQLNYLYKISLSGVIFLALEIMFLSHFHLISIAVSIVLAVPYFRYNLRVARAIETKFLEKYTKQTVENPAS